MASFIPRIQFQKLKKKKLYESLILTKKNEYSDNFGFGNSCFC